MLVLNNVILTRLVTHYKGIWNNVWEYHRDIDMKSKE